MKILVLIIMLFINNLIYPAMQEPLVDPFESTDNLAKFDFNTPNDYPSDIQINLLTLDPGNEIYSYYGHTGLEVINHNQKIVFDYGVFSFSDTFILDFLFGELFYLVYPSDGEYTYLNAINENRTLHKLDLKIPEDKKDTVFDYLIYNSRSQNNTYLYHHYLDNCATRVRDIYNATTNDDFKLYAESINTNFSYRDYILSLTNDKPSVSWVLSFLQSGLIDNKLNLYQACFLPLMLNNAIETYINEEAVVEVEGKQMIKLENNLLLQSSIFSIILFALLLVLRFKNLRIYNCFNFIIHLVLGILGSVLLFLMFYTHHNVTYFNENILLVNPLNLIIAVCYLVAIFKKQTKVAPVLNTLLVFNLIALMISKFILPTILIQNNWAIIVVIAPVYLISYFSAKNSSTSCRS